MAAARREQSARDAAIRSAALAQRTSEADRKRLEKEVAAAHAADMQAEVDHLNEELAATYSDLDGLLSATLDVDDFVDLEKLRVHAEHPPFRSDLETPTAPPDEVVDPPEPSMRAVVVPRSPFGRQKKLDEDRAQAQAAYDAEHQAWVHYVAQLPEYRTKLADYHAAVEAQRLQQLAAERQRYDGECAEREKEAAAQNAKLDELIAGLGYGTVEAVREYIGIVLANSVYPEHFDVEHEPTFDPSSAELQLKVLIPGPGTLPTIKAHRYVKATDQIAELEQTQKDSKARYASVVDQIALRTLHEVFEADRRGLIRSISLEVGTDATSPATGKSVYVPLVGVAATRDRFVEIDLSAVVPRATLDHLAAVVSRSPFDLVPASTSGVRRS
jgi:restriction system protein